MTDIKPSDHGIVVEHKEHGIRYAVSDRNYNPKVHRKVRDLKPGESVHDYAPRRREPLGDQQTETSGAGSPGPAGDAAVVSGDSR
jgi:hypothetical protein